jgi:hypothetical protein
MTLRDRSLVAAFAILFVAVSTVALASTIVPGQPAGSPGPASPPADHPT